MILITPILAAVILAHCHVNGDLPDSSPTCTPGAVATTDLRIICGTSTRTRRNVDEATRRERFAAYGVAWADRNRYELDHLCPLEAGGSNAKENLWPEPLAEAHIKDQVEDRSHRAICAGTMTVENAQRAFMTDWRTIR